MRSAGPYADARVVFATMHGKEQLAQGPFRDILQAEVVAVSGVDTDQLGTFAGETARTLHPRVAARVKAHLALHVAQTPFALASEGSFSSGMGVLIEHHEILVFVDATRDLELVESSITTSPLPPRRTVATVELALRHAGVVGFPQQRLVIRGEGCVNKSEDTLAGLARAVDELLRRGDPVSLEPDFRAHHCPTRAEVIHSLAARMAHRLATECPQCHAPGFGAVDIARGVPCADCGSATRVIAADILGCGRCEYTVRALRADRTASPRWCDYCNP